MGEQGSKRTGDAKESAERFAAALEPLGDVTTKGMFGGYGIFHDGKMFGIVDSSGAWYLKADEATSRRYESAGSEKHGRMPYWSVPEEVAADEPKLQEWARDAIQA